eukprot:1161480-Pelagomonas_calceolata.AAC.22
MCVLGLEEFGMHTHLSSGQAGMGPMQGLRKFGMHTLAKLKGLHAWAFWRKEALQNKPKARYAIARQERHAEVVMVVM